MGRLKLQGKIAAVTGGARGLGRAIVEALAAEGADVALSTREVDGARDVLDAVRAAGRRAFVARADARVPGEIGSFVKEAVLQLGGLDILVNNAGVFHAAPLASLTEEQLDEAFDVNLKAAVMASQAAAPSLRERGGVIVNVASLGGLRPWRSYLPYCASKAALVMATECLALALAPEVRVNAVAPGILEEPGGASPQVKAKIPLRRFGATREAVEAVMFLVTAAHYTTGAVLRVDGGRGLS